MQGAAGRVRAKLSAEAAVTGGVKLRQSAIHQSRVCDQPHSALGWLQVGRGVWGGEASTQ